MGIVVGAWLDHALIDGPRKGAHEARPYGQPAQRWSDRVPASPSEGGGFHEGGDVPFRSAGRWIIHPQGSFASATFFVCAAR